MHLFKMALKRANPFCVAIVLISSSIFITCAHQPSVSKSSTLEEIAFLTFIKTQNTGKSLYKEIDKECNQIIASHTRNALQQVDPATDEIFSFVNQSRLLFSNKENAKVHIARIVNKNITTIIKQGLIALDSTLTNYADSLKSLNQLMTFNTLKTIENETDTSKYFKESSFSELKNILYEEKIPFDCQSRFTENLADTLIYANLSAVPDDFKNMTIDAIFSVLEGASVITGATVVNLSLFPAALAAAVYYTIKSLINLNRDKKELMNDIKSTLSDSIKAFEELARNIKSDDIRYIKQCNDAYLENELEQIKYKLRSSI